MNWKLIIQLSAFGLIMAFATVSLIPEKIEPLFWLVIFVFCAYVIAKTCAGKYFLHGVVLGLINSLWIAAVHTYFYTSYVANHAGMGKMADEHPIIPLHPRLSMLITGPFFGLGFGLVLGLFCFIASKIVAKKPVLN